MSVKELRRKIKKALDDLAEERLISLADIVATLNRPPTMTRIHKAEKDLRAGRGKCWRELRSMTYAPMEK